MVSATGELRHGQVIDGRYRIGLEIGRGAMGIVYEAQHLRLERRVAVKVLHAELASDHDSCERFEREARAAARIGSEQIVDVHDVGDFEGTRYLVMEHLRGETLKEYFSRLAPLAPEDLLPLMTQILDGLAAAHDAGIVHRDVKPENIFLVDGDDEPAVKILDFGVSKFRDVGASALKSRTGVVLGTPHYMAPEQARGLRDVDRRADIFAAGIVLYEGLSGRRPFTAPNVNQLLFRIALDDVPKLGDKLPGIDPALEAIVSKATQRDPDRRYQSARQFADDVRAWLFGDEVEALASLAERGEERPSAPTSSPGDLELGLDEPTRDAPLDAPADTAGATTTVTRTDGPTSAPARGPSWVALVGVLAVAAGGLALGLATGREPAQLERGLPPPPTVLPAVAPSEAPPDELEVPPEKPAALPPLAIPRPAPKAPPAAKTPRPIRRDL
ncbi:MAG: serine/threonine-protein kinase [Polyangiaceae bacterium]